MLYIKLGANPGAVGGGSGIPTPVKSTKPAASAQTDALDSFPDMDVDSRKHFKVRQLGFSCYLTILACNKRVYCEV